MKKEIIIALIIIALIVFLNIITSNYTNKVMEEMTSSLNEIRTQLVAKNNDNLRNNVDEIITKWSKEKDVLAFYIEHTELEKVELYIHEMNSNVETEEYNIAIQALDSCKFIISHIKDKYKVALKNIF